MQFIRDHRVCFELLKATLVAVCTAGMPDTGDAERDGKEPGEQKKADHYAPPDTLARAARKSSA